jgi:hypothetical protein
MIARRERKTPARLAPASVEAIAGKCAMEEDTQPA